MTRATSLAAIDSLRFDDPDSYQYWKAVILEPPRLSRVPFVNVVLRPDGLLLDHLAPPADLPAFEALRPPDPCALFGSEPNVTYCLNGLASPAPLHDGALLDMRTSFPRLVLPSPVHPPLGTAHPAFSLGSPVDFRWSPTEVSVCIPDRLAPLRSGSLLRGRPPPDAAFTDALCHLAHSLDDSSIFLAYGVLQTVAALGARLDPPPHNHALIGVWRPPHLATALHHHSDATLVISLTVVGSRMPLSSGFVRGTLPSGWIVFQRRSPALHPYVLNDYFRFVRLATGYLGPLALVAGSAPSALPASFYLTDLPRTDESPYVPLEDASSPLTASDLE